MPDYTEFIVELDRILEENSYDERTIKVLKQWFVSILKFYNPSDDILGHCSVEQYIKYNLEKLRQAKDIKVFKIEEIIHNPNSLLYKCIEEIPCNSDLVTRFSKSGECYIVDGKGNYYLSAKGVCHGGKSIELVDQTGVEHVLQHELQHINQSYIYPSEFPFAKDMLTMLSEGESEYHYHLIDLFPKYLPIKKEYQYYIYYLVYTLLMLTLPKEMCNSWKKRESICPYTDTFAEIFKYISDSESRKNFSELFSFATLIVASCNPENTREIFDGSVNTCLNQCSKRIDIYHQTINQMLDLDRKNNLEDIEYHMEMVNERINLLQNPTLLQEKYLEVICDEKEFIASEPKEAQEELLQELQLFTLERFKSILMEEIEAGKKSIQKYQTKKEKTPYEILGDVDYKKFKYYEFGIELSETMQFLLKQELSFTSLFEQFLEKVTSCLIENKDSGLDEKLAFIDEIRRNSLVSGKKF